MLLKAPGRTNWLWLCLIVVVALVAVLMLVVIRWKRTKGKDDNEGLTSNPTVTQSAPETSQDTAYPQEGVSYASISYTKKTDSRAQVGSKNDDHENDVVTYSTVRTPSAEPNSLYTSIT
ncbi:uncharacterized protein LOC111231687 isoform X2 [Seriola dumerili]|uniref:uncharacterized protein LOC111231687 isoform X2 n=1 Tax=Seriola dumerili TaxID=41447 RepID=UPI000BBF1F6F|nr:uncharacterized protein LOC111231687 isoform X2 [Seriola dumerili]